MTETKRTEDQIIAQEKIKVTPEASEIIRDKDILLVIGPNDKIEKLKKKH